MPTPPRNIESTSVSKYGSIARSPFGNSYLATSPIAHESLARDIAEDSEGEFVEEEEDDNDEDEDDDDEDDSATGSDSTVRPDPQSRSMSHGRRHSNVAYGGSRPTATPRLDNHNYLSKKDKKEARKEELSLLRDNHLKPRKNSHVAKKTTFWNKIYDTLFSTEVRERQSDPEEPAQNGHDAASAPTEESALLRNGNETTREGHERRNRVWEEAVAAGKIKTTWQRETKTLAKYASPMVVTFVLQYSLTVASIFTVGHIGPVELGAVSLASMTANITAYSLYQGLATSLDTLCAQAYGSGRKKLVGLQFQRMVYFLFACTIPIGVLWLYAERVLKIIVPEKRSAELAGLYLRILLCGAPGYALFESAKRFVQAQGLFSATTYVLLIAAPINAFMNWLFVWHFKWGFVGAPIAVAITDNLLPILLFLYVYFVDGIQCWNGFTWKAFHNWGPMIKLALPGLLMVEAEYLAFEILTLASSYFSTTHLAAQSILGTLTALTFQIPFSISIAASTRVANLIGATLSGAAKTSGKVSIYGAVLSGLINVLLLSSLRNKIPQLFTNDADVIKLVADVLPLCAAFQLFDALAATMNGLLRGLGRQEVGGWVNLFCYYVVAMPLSFGTAFGLGWELKGLWTGVAIALGLVAAIEGWFLMRIDWARAVEDAKQRNEVA